MIEPVAKAEHVPRRGIESGQARAERMREAEGEDRRSQVR
jgi:hypothetical protein